MIIISKTSAIKFGEVEHAKNQIHVPTEMKGGKWFLSDSAEKYVKQKGIAYEKRNLLKEEIIKRELWA